MRLEIHTQNAAKEMLTLNVSEKKCRLLKSSAEKTAYTIDLCMYGDIQSGPISVPVMQSRLLHKEQSDLGQKVLYM